IGTIFGIYRRKSPEGPGQLADCLQPASRLAAAGYIIYGSSTMLVYSAGGHVDGFTLDPSVGEFLLSHPRLRIPDDGLLLSANLANRRRWPAPVRAWARSLFEAGLGASTPPMLRYSGAAVADVHRVLLGGGLFAYPGDADHAAGKLRLLYEAGPLAFIMQAAGGAATDGKTDILHKQPAHLHERTPLFIGSPDNIRAVRAHLQSSAAPA
ncbi:MAG: class 1 fructose-bisphosphatase, partial [Polyangiales bacterium]